MIHSTFLTMHRVMEVLALIPARSGSKGIPDKNIKLFRGKPLLVHSVDQAIQARSVTRVMTSTDSEKYAEIARNFGAEAPFLRPENIAGDRSTDLEVFDHALRWLDEHEAYQPDICVHLRPTYPTRLVKDIDRAVEMLIADRQYDSVRTVTRAPETPFKMWFMDEHEMLESVVKTDIPDPYNCPRQELPKTYLQTASIDVVWSRVIREQGSMSGRRIRGLVTEEFHDIDTMAQWEEAESEAPISTQDKTFVFDIDGVIATLTPENNYPLAEPQVETIRMVNALYDAGNRIILFTARGTMTGIDWTQLTEQQMNTWGVKYHELKFGKPAGDYYIDDRLITLRQLDRSLSNAEKTFHS